MHFPVEKSKYGKSTQLFVRVNINENGVWFSIYKTLSSVYNFPFKINIKFAFYDPAFNILKKQGKSFRFLLDYFSLSLKMEVVS